MTNERAIELLHRLQNEQFDGIHGDERREALEMAVRAMSGHGDTISRQQAIAIVRHRCKRCTTEAVLAITEIEQLPPVQPERKKGQNDQPESAKEYCAECDHIEMCGWYPYEGCEFRSIPQPQRKRGEWIPVDSFSAFGGDEAMWMAHGNPVAFYYCSECKEQAYAGEDGESLLTDFCPFCGADMRGESE